MIGFTIAAVAASAAAGAIVARRTGLNPDLVSVAILTGIALAIGVTP